MFKERITFKKKIWGKRGIAVCLVVTFLIPMTNYAMATESDQMSEKMIAVESQVPRLPINEAGTAESETESTAAYSEQTPLESEETESAISESEETESAISESEETESAISESEETEPAMSESEETEPATFETKQDVSETESLISDTDTLDSETQRPEGAEESAESEKSAEQESKAGGTNSNETLIASKQLVIPPFIEESFRFVTIDKVYAVVQQNNVNVYDDAVGDDDKPVVVGTLQKDDLCYVIKEEEESDWIYIESDIVRGFVKKEVLLAGDAANELVREKGEEGFTYATALAEPVNDEVLTYTKIPGQTNIDKVYGIAISGTSIYEEKNAGSQVIGKLAGESLCYIIADAEEHLVFIESNGIQGFVKAKQLITGDEANQLVYEKGEESFSFAKALVEPAANEGLTYTKTTTQQTVIDKVYGIVDTPTLNIYEGKNIDSRITGELLESSLCYIIADAKEDWIFIESNDVRGFVQSENLIQGDEADALVEETGEENLKQAVEMIPIEENEACYYTLTSIKEGVGGNAIRASMLAYAKQFLGNPYVWGGTSLTNGADCSGFVQSIYAQYGYSLPRVAEDQAEYGMQISVESAAPGDLIFYARNGYIYHVVMYIGEGKVIHASSSKTGIIISEVDMVHAVWATRIINDSDTPDSQGILVQSSPRSLVYTYTAATASSRGKYLGEFKLTAYCACKICCGQWADGNTASGTLATEGRTVAMGGIPLGTKLVVNGMIFTVEDRGTPYGHIDIYMTDHNRCLEFGVGTAVVYLAK